MPVKKTAATDPEAQLGAFIGRFDPSSQKLFTALRTALRKRYPTANELVHNYGHACVVAYSPTQHPIHGILSISLRADGVQLYLNGGAQLADPKKLLKGSAKLVRYIEVESASGLSNPDVKALMAAAVDQASIPFPAKGKGDLIIRSDSATSSAKGKTRK